MGERFTEESFQQFVVVIIYQLFSIYPRRKLILETVPMARSCFRRPQSRSWSLCATTPGWNVTRSWRPWDPSASLNTLRCPPETGRSIWSRPRLPTREALPMLISRSSAPTPPPPWWRTPGLSPSSRTTPWAWPRPPTAPMWRPTPVTSSTRSRWGTGGSSSPVLWRPQEATGPSQPSPLWPRTWWWWATWPTLTSRDKSRCSRPCQQRPCHQQGNYVVLHITTAGVVICKFARTSRNLSLATPPYVIKVLNIRWFDHDVVSPPLAALYSVFQV